MNKLFLGMIMVASAACAGSAPTRALVSGSSAKERAGGNGVAGGALCARVGFGFVNSVRKSTVEIALGSSDGVREGDAYHVWRWGGIYVGRMRINAVEKYNASGVLISSTATAYAPPQPGDLVEDAHMWHEYR